MSDHDNKNSGSWFKAATLCVAFACVAGAPATHAQPSVDKAATHAVVDAKGEHRKLLERQIDLSSALATLGGSSQETVAKYRTEAKAGIDAKATGNADEMKHTATANRGLERNLQQMTKAMTVSRA